MTRKFNPDEVTFSLTAEPEDLAPDFDFGDGTNERILTEAEHNVWAWASVTVSASWGGFTGNAYLGGCNYADAADFRVDGYFEDMLKEALKDLLSEIKGAGWGVDSTKEEVAAAVAREVGNTPTAIPVP